MSNKTTSAKSVQPARQSALDDFLPEAYLPANAVRLDLFETPAALAPPAALATASVVQMWPMLAAGCIVFGVSLIALTLVAKLGVF